MAAQSPVKLNFSLHPRQVEAFNSTASEILYGGSAGGGKSFLMRISAIASCMEVPGLQVYLLRRQATDLQKNHIEGPSGFPILIAPLVKADYAKIVYSPNVEISFKNGPSGGYEGGSKIFLVHCKDENSKYNFQGCEIHYFLVDEATHLTETQYTFMRSRVRLAGLKIPDHVPTNKYPRILLGSNPGGIGHCVPFGEVLTKDGWKDIKDFSIGDHVYTLNKDGKLIDASVDQTHASIYSGNMINVSMRGLTMCCTPNHKIAKVAGERGVQTRGDKFSLVRWDDLPGQTVVLRSASSWEGVDFGPVVPEVLPSRIRRISQPTSLSGDDFAELFGWFITEGCVVDRDKAVSITQLKTVTREKLITFLNNCGFSLCVTTKGVIIHGMDWWNHLKGFGHCREKYIPDYLKNGTTSQLNRLFTSLVDGDGHWVKYGKSGQFYTTSKRLSDDFQEVVFKLGFITTVSSRSREDREGLAYCISFKKTVSGGTEILTGNHCYNVTTKTKRMSTINKDHYEGMVYCIGVKDTHNFIIRQNGSVWVSGNSWVKSMFIDGAAPMELREMPDEDGGLLRQYIPARLSDNPTLLENDPKYAARLKGLGNDALVKAMLEGDWDVFQGQAFNFCRRDHVIPPQPIPAWAPVTMTMDWGFGAPFAICWFWTDSDGRVYQFAEWYGWTGKPNQGLRITDTEIAKGILEREAAMGIAHREIDRLAGHDCFSKKPDYNGGGQGPSTAEIMSQHGIFLRKADPNKVLKLRQFHERLRVPEDGQRPMYQVYDTCHQTIRTLPTLVMKENNPEVLEDHGAEDHLADAIAQIFMARPMGFDDNAPTKSLEQRLVEAFETATSVSDTQLVAGYYGEATEDPIAALLDQGQPWNMDW